MHSQISTEDEIKNGIDYNNCKNTMVYLQLVHCVVDEEYVDTYDNQAQETGDNFYDAEKEKLFSEECETTEVFSAM